MRLQEQVFYAPNHQRQNHKILVFKKLYSMASLLNSQHHKPQIFQKDHQSRHIYAACFFLIELTEPIYSGAPKGEPTKPVVQTFPNVESSSNYQKALRYVVN